MTPVEVNGHRVIRKAGRDVRICDGTQLASGTRFVCRLPIQTGQITETHRPHRREVGSAETDTTVDPA